MLTIMTNMGEVAATLLGLPTSLGLSLHQEGIRALLFTSVCGAKDISQCRSSLSISCTFKLYLALDNVQVPEIDRFLLQIQTPYQNPSSSSSSVSSINTKVPIFIIISIDIMMVMMMMTSRKVCLQIPRQTPRRPQTHTRPASRTLEN